MCRRVCVQENVHVPPRQQTDVLARSTLLSLDRVADNCIVDSHQVQPGVYVGRTLLPRSHHDLRVRMINTTSEPFLLTKDTCLGNLCQVQVLDDRSKQAERVEQLQVNACSSEAAGQPVADADQSKSDDVRASLMSKLPAELTDAEGQQVEKLLSDHDDILSRGPYDMGRITLVEHTIDTGSQKPIRQGLRRHPMAQLDLIDEQVNELVSNDFVESAASPLGF